MEEFSSKDLSDLLHANELALSRLSDEEREILDKIDDEKEATEERFGRPLTDEELMTIEQGIPGGWEVVEKVGDMIAPAVKEIRKGEKQ